MATVVRMKFDATRYNPSPEYARLITSHLPLIDIAVGLGVCDKTLNNWRAKGFPSYIVQFSVEEFIMERMGVSREQVSDG